jgi:hypothetical protein
MDCTPADLRVYAAIGAPRCCGQPMALPLTEPRPTGRTGDRRPARVNSRADVRRVGSAVGDDLGAGLTDVSADGAGVRLTDAVVVGEELAVALVLPGGRVAARATGRVQWCRPIGNGMFAAGLGFDRPLGLTELASLI